MCETHVDDGLEIPESSCNRRSEQKLSENSVFPDDGRQECLMDQHKLTTEHKFRKKKKKFEKLTANGSFTLVRASTIGLVDTPLEKGGVACIAITSL